MCNRDRIRDFGLCINSGVLIGFKSCGVNKELIALAKLVSLMKINIKVNLFPVTSG
jgi:hypothetical protein